MRFRWCAILCVIGVAAHVGVAGAAAGIWDCKHDGYGAAAHYFADDDKGGAHMSFYGTTAANGWLSRIQKGSIDVPGGSSKSAHLGFARPVCSPPPAHANNNNNNNITCAARFVNQVPKEYHNAIPHAATLSVLVTENHGQVLVQCGLSKERGFEF
jgi:hypothetical protein